MPGAGANPDVWLLGSSDYSAQVAAMLGLPFAFAHHFSPANTLPALALYRRLFRPSETPDHPLAMIGVSVTCAETDAEAQRLAGPAALSFLRVRTGRPSTLPSPEEAAAYPYTPEERAFVDGRRASQVIGSPESVRTGLQGLLEATAADELMVTTTTFDPADRIRSFEFVADLAHLSSRAHTATGPGGVPH